MRWVNETLPPRLRLRWLLITMRLSISSLAGIARTLVAVGTWRLASMFVTTRADAPRSGRTSGPSSDPAAGFAAAWAAGAFAGGVAGGVAGFAADVVAGFAADVVAGFAGL